MIRQLASVVLLMLSSAAVAQTIETTPNLITSGQNHTWTGVATGSYTLACPPNGGACSGGPGAMYDPNTNTIYFSYGQSTAAQTFAINQALANSGSGIIVQGYNYSWDILNNNNYRTDQAGTDTVTARVLTYNIDGALRRTDSWTYNTKFDWTTFSGTVNFVNPAEGSTLGNLRVEFTGSDSGFWGGYFGPQVRNVSIGMNYTVDPCVSNPQSSPACPGFKTFYTIPDDGHAIVPIPFGFPFYGQVFTHSIFFDNGAVSFYSPTQPQRWGGGGFGGYAINSSLPASHFYTIMPLNTDLIANGGLHYTQGNSNYLRYTWDGVSQFGRWDSKNTFSLEIRPTGHIGLQYNQIDIEGGWTSGIVGNASLGEFITFNAATGSAFSVSETVATDCSNPLNNINCPGYAEALFQQQCSANVLYSPACPGYAQAYFTQQCSLNTLYDPLCPGYATAYYTYQCSLDALYHTGCPGYTEAYFDQQCALDPLYNNQCSGYATAYFNQQCGLNPLYNNQCPGYDDAYYVQQCTLDPLYDSGCTGYDAAFLAQQCSLNTLYDLACPGYAEAYFDQQCGLNALYNQTCPGYETAYFDQQCGLNTLYNENCPGYTQAFYNLQCSISALFDSGCPGYAQAYFDQQCGLDPLYNNQCPDYAQTYALKFVIAPLNTSSAPVAEEPVGAGTAAVEEPVITSVAETAPPAATASPAEPAAPVQLIAEPTPVAAPQTAAPTPAKTESASAAPRTTRQALAEQRLAAAKEQAAKSAQENPDAVTAEMDSAGSFEQQTEIQNTVLGAMGFVAGFDAYGRATLPDAAGYKPFEIYPGQRNIDTPAARGLVGRSDRIHEEMVNEQYR
jgi:hypothetical protein